MRVRIVFLLRNKGAFLPFHHQYLLAQMIEQTLAEPTGYWKNFTTYTFSGLKGQTKVSKNGLHYFSSRVTLVLSSLSSEFIDAFIQRLFEEKDIALGDLQLTIEAAERELPMPLPDGRVGYVCISPIVATSPSGNPLNAKKFIPPETDAFSDLLYETVMNRMEASGIFTAEQIASFYKFQLIPDKDYLQKIKESDKKFARIYPVYDPAGNKSEVRGYTFPFTLFAAPEVHKFIFDCGLGALCEKGFGMLDLAQADVIRKTEPYLVAAPQLVGIQQQQNGHGKYL